MKLRFWQEKVQAGRYDIFEKTSDSLSSLCRDDVNKVSVVIREHLFFLSEELDNYFPNITDSDCQLIRNRFKTNPR